MTSLTAVQKEDIEKTLEKLDVVRRDIASALNLSEAGQIDAGIVLTIQELALKELWPLIPKSVAVSF